MQRLHWSSGKVAAPGLISTDLVAQLIQGISPPEADKRRTKELYTW
jgi:hypothetical protein